MVKGMVLFEYEKPEPPQAKKSVKLARTEFIAAAVQNVGPDGATNLHSHSGNDGFWLVLAGRARFYTDAEEPFAELGPQQGVLVPHGTKYWFESADDDVTLEILHVSARTSAKLDKRIDYKPRLRQQSPADSARA